MSGIRPKNNAMNLTSGCTARQKKDCTFRQKEAKKNILSHLHQNRLNQDIKYSSRFHIDLISFSVELYLKCNNNFVHYQNIKILLTKNISVSNFCEIKKSILVPSLSIMIKAFQAFRKSPTSGTVSTY